MEANLKGRARNPQDLSASGGFIHLWRTCPPLANRRSHCRLLLGEPPARRENGLLWLETSLVAQIFL